MTDRITKQDIADVARRLRIEPAALAAVLAVECRWPRRRGFDSEGRVRILYEPHIAFRILRRKRRFKDIRELSAAKIGGQLLAYPKQGMMPYPRSNALRWKQLEKAVSLAGEIAYEFASYGLPQIMGFNHAKAGYDSAKAMVEAFSTGEREQLEALGRFLSASKSMIDALENGHWARFARAYNGRGYKRNRYDEKLREAYARFARQDWPEGHLPGEHTAWSGAQPAPTSPSPSEPKPTPPPAGASDHGGDSSSGSATIPAASDSPAQLSRRAGLFAALAAALAAAAGGIAAAWDWLVNFFH